MAPKNLSFKIILGSSSMARRKILADMGYEFTVMSANIDEKSIRKDNAEELVVALAEAKIFKAISYIHLLVSRWRYTKELLEKNYQVRKKRSSSSNAILVVKPRL